MKTFLPLVAAIFAFVVTMPRALAAPPSALKAKTEFDGTIKSITATSISVAGPKGMKTFVIYPGTVFGQRATKQLSEFKVGERVRVVFSESGTKAQAENIRNPDDDKKPGAAKKK